MSVSTKGQTPEQEESGETTEISTKSQTERDEAQSEEDTAKDDEEPDDRVPRVLVTGASGYIALHVTKRLLQDGRFRVRGSVRNKNNKDKIQPLLDLAPDAKYPLRLIEADLLNPESWKKAVKSCSYVFHIASPCPAAGQPLSEEVLIPPAVEGTLSVLRACVEAGTVKRVILTSSTAAVCHTNLGIPGKPADYVYSESDWSDEATCAPYEKSKLRAERAAWDFVQKLDEDKKFELVVLNPGYVQGPLLSPATGDVSKMGCVPILKGEVLAIPNIFMPCIDVRDVVAAQMAALEKPEAAGHRYLLASATLCMRELAQMIAEEFKPQGYKISTMPLLKPVMWVARFFDSNAKFLYPYVAAPIQFSSEKMLNELGITPYALKDTIMDTCYSLVDIGVVKRTPGYLGHPSTRPPSSRAAESGAVTVDLPQKEQPEHDSARTNEESPTDNEPEKQLTQESKTTQS